MPVCSTITSSQTGHFAIFVCTHQISMVEGAREPLSTMGIPNLMSKDPKHMAPSKLVFMTAILRFFNSHILMP